MSVVPVVNLVIEKGTDFETSFYTTAEARLKKYPTSPTSYNFNVGITTADGEISISMGRTMTSTLPSGRTYFDVFITNTELDFRTRVVTGSIIVEDTTL